MRLFCCRQAIEASIVLAAMGLFAPFAHGDLQILGYQDRLHDPFYVGADKAFIGAPYNWSGVGRIADPAPGGVNWKSLTMISDNYFITANHNSPYRGNDPAGAAPKVRFYRTTDPNGEFWETELAISGSNYVGERIGQTDLWVGKLASTPPDWVMRYPLAKRHELTNHLSYTDDDMLVFGQDSPRGYSSVRVGRNEVEQVDMAGNLSWTFDVKGGLGADEAETQVGDSGAPSFFANGNLPVLAGIHTRSNFDTGISRNIYQIAMAVGEQLSYSTGLPGDVNGDFKVSIVDLTTVASNFGKSTGKSLRRGDLNGDLQVNITDLGILSQNLGASLYAPSDFDQDGDVDGYDLATIGENWLRSVSGLGTHGDANRDGFVNLADLEVFDRNQYRAYFGPLPAPLSAIEGDVTGNGVVDGFDLSVITGNLNKVVTPGTDGDVDGNGVVNLLDVSFVSTRLGSSFGDLNGDHEVGPLDFAILANNFNRQVAGGRLAGDLSGNGWVNASDAYILFQWWGQQNGAFPEMLIPEPASGVLALSALSLWPALARRRYFSRARLRYRS